MMNKDEYIAPGPTICGDEVLISRPVTDNVCYCQEVE